ncbi:MAG: nitrite/sulfite reductase [Dehalococcoidia bacterium]|nr:nitrite/sulfite reductase [Dehalococcoidia bacterium]
MKIEIEETGVVPIVEEELEAFDAESGRFLKGENDPMAFQAYRLKEGVYGQRQADAQMIRVKVPGGILSARQMEVLGDVARNYAPLDKGHITTRENIQYHHVPLEDSAKSKWDLAKVGITSREACGNTVRNVNSCPLAGICRDEVFDVTPYLSAYVRYFIRKPFTQALPRKFKTSFSPCLSDCATASFHDLGFVAQIKEIDGVQRKGFRMQVGGGSSIMPRVAPVLYEFVPVEEYLRISEAVLKVFNRSDELRKNRMMARIKVLVDRVGIDVFREMVEEELKQPWAKEPIDPTPYLLNRYEKTPEPYSHTNGSKNPGESDPAYRHWKSTNIQAQRQPGYYAVFVKVAQGDLSSDQFYKLAQLSRDYGNGSVRLNAEQNLVFRWVPEHELFNVWQALQNMDLGEGGVHEITDTTSCPGTDSCKLGITASMGANRAIRQRLLDLQFTDPLVRQMHIKISGCPNGCGRHHVADIGLQGAAVKGEGGQQVPAYEVYIGGNFQGADFRYAKRVSTKIPSKRTPDAIESVISFYTQQRQEGEPFNKFVDRVGYKAFEDVLSVFKGAGPVSENIELYQDWERMGLYQLERGEGECAV